MQTAVSPVPIRGIHQLAEAAQARYCVEGTQRDIRMAPDDRRQRAAKS